MKPMRNTLLFAAMLAFVFSAQAQSKKIAEVTEDADKTEVSLFNDRIHVTDDYFGDTTYVRVGRHNIEIIEDGHRTRIDVHKDEDWDDDYGWRKHRKKFNGHWAGVELGFNGFYDTDYSLYSNNEFMDLNQPKSIEVNLNFLEYNIPLQKELRNVGLVTGFGYSINNFRFDNPYTIDKEGGMIVPKPLTPNEVLKKSKFTVSYLTVPLMLEFQIPVNDFSNKIHIAGGFVGGLNLGSRTKVKMDHSKTKDRGGFNVNLFKYAATARVGLKGVCLYANYSLSPLFKDGDGPEVFPFSIGIALVNL